MKENFEKTDEAFMKKLRPLRERRLNERLLSGFTASVERKIASAGSPVGAGIRRWAPFTAAPAILGLVALLWITYPAENVQLAQLSDPDALSAEIAALKDLGEWTEADERGVWTQEESLEIELSQVETPSRIG